MRGGISFAIRKENRECTVNLVNRGNTACVHTLFNLSAGLSGALHDITFVFRKNYIAEVREKGGIRVFPRTQKPELVSRRSNLILRMHSVSPARLIHAPGARNPELFVWQSTAWHFELTDSAAV